MSALETTLAGNDEGLNRIGLRNPGEIFKSWGAGADTASRFGAILNEVMSVGNAVAGSYAAGMQTAQGAVERLTNAKETFLVTLGQAITGGEGYSGVLGSLTSTVQMMTSAVTANAGAIRDFVRDLASIAAAGAGALAFLGRIGATLNVVNAQMQVASAYARVGLMFGQGDSRANLDRALAGLRSADAAFANPTASPRGEDPLAEQNELRDLRALQGAPATATPTTLGGARARPRSTAGGDTASPFAPLLAGGPAGIANTMTGGALGVRPLLGTVPATIRVAPKIEAPGFVAEMQRFYQNAGRIISGGMAQGLAASIQNGVRAAFEGRGVTGVIRAFGATMLSAVGGIFVELGETYLMYGGIMQGLAALLPNPFTAGPAGLAIGAALIALGTALNGVASGRGRGGGGGGSFSAPGVGGDVFRGIVLNPRAAPVGGQFAPTGRSGMPATARPVVNNFTVIGQNDPTAQRQIANMVATATRRGIT
jgi:hypothetical protein